MKCNEDGERVGLADNYLEVHTRDAWDLYNRITPARLVEIAGDVLIAEALDD